MVWIFCITSWIPFGCSGFCFQCKIHSFQPCLICCWGWNALCSVCIELRKKEIMDSVHMPWPLIKIGPPPQACLTWLPPLSSISLQIGSEAVCLHIQLASLGCFLNKQLILSLLYQKFCATFCFANQKGKINLYSKQKLGRNLIALMNK